MVRECVSRILFESIPTCLFRGLVNVTYGAGRLKSWLRINQQALVLERVYDLLNCGSRTRFTAGVCNQRILLNCVYSMQYGAYPPRMHIALTNDGVDITLAEVEQIHAAFHDTFPDLRRYAEYLTELAQSQGGYVENAFGLPMCMFREGRINTFKDAFSRVNQSTGHILLVMFCCILRRRLDEALPGLWHPVIWDLHDAVTIEVPEEHEKLAKQIMIDTMEELNYNVRGRIQLSGIPTSGLRMSDVKEPED